MGSFDFMFSSIVSLKKSFILHHIYFFVSRSALAQARFNVATELSAFSKAKKKERKDARKQQREEVKQAKREARRKAKEAKEWEAGAPDRAAADKVGLTILLSFY